MKELSVREINLADISHIVDYWLGSPVEHLMGMGVDLTKLPGEGQWRDMLESQIDVDYMEKKSFCLICSLDNVPIGHCNIDRIVYGESAYMYIHLWQPNSRQKGLGVQLIKKAIPIFFDKYKIKTLHCEPYSENPAPHKALELAGFSFVKEHITIPGSINFEQSVKLWKLERTSL